MELNAVSNAIVKCASADTAILAPPYRLVQSHRCIKHGSQAKQPGASAADSAKVRTEVRTSLCPVEGIVWKQPHRDPNHDTEQLAEQLAARLRDLGIEP